MDIQSRRLYLCVFFKGPFEILMDALWSIDSNCDIILEIPDGSIRDRLATMVERLDVLWREWYVFKETDPQKAWRRQF